MGSIATDDIPLEKVVTHASATGVRSNSMTALHTQHSTNPNISDQSEKNGMFRRGRRRKQEGGGAGAAKAEEEGGLRTMGRIYQKIVSFGIIARYLIYVLPVGALIAIPIIIGATSARKSELGNLRILWLFTWIEIVWLGLWASKLVAHFLPYLFQFVVGVVSSGVRKYALVLKALEIPLSLVGWALVSLLTFTPMMLRNPDTEEAAKKDRKYASLFGWQSVVRQVLAACLVCSLVFLAERLLIQLISINYHRKQFAEKIQENKHNVYLLGLLYEASCALFPEYCQEFREEDHIINDGLNLSALGDGAKAPKPIHMLKNFGRNVGRVGDKVTSVFGNLAQEITGQDVMNPNSAHSVVIEALEKKRACEALARRLWMSFVMEGRDELYEDDIIEVLGTNRHDDAIECFSVFDQDGNGDVTLEEAILTVTNMGRERKSIANSMHDVDQAINVLDGLLSVVVFIIAVFIFVGFLNASFTTTLATAGTALLSLSFVFAATCQEVLGSCIFLFVKHPYDIGDRVDLTTGTDQLIVEHISLLFTVFKRVQTGKMVQIPNIVLNNLWIEIVRGSLAMREYISVFCAFDTSFEDIQSLKEEMIKFVESKENSRDYLPTVDIDVIGIAEMNKMELRVEVCHKSNWANETVRATRRSKFMCALVLALRRVPIYGPGGGDPALGDVGKPSFSVAITAEEAQANKDAAAAKKEAKRLYPTKKDEAVTSGTDLANTAHKAEETAVQQINLRSVTKDARDDAFELDDGRTINERTSLDGRGRQSSDSGSGLLRSPSNASGRRNPSAHSGYPHNPALTPPAEEPHHLFGSSGHSAVPPARTYAPIPAPASLLSQSSTLNGNAPQNQQSYIPAPAPAALPSTFIPGNAFSGPPPAGSPFYSPPGRPRASSRAGAAGGSAGPPPVGGLPVVPRKEL